MKCPECGEEIEEIEIMVNSVMQVKLNHEVGQKPSVDLPFTIRREYWDVDDLWCPNCYASIDDLVKVKW